MLQLEFVSQTSHPTQGAIDFTIQNQKITPLSLHIAWRFISLLKGMRWKPAICIMLNSAKYNSSLYFSLHVWGLFDVLLLPYTESQKSHRSHFLFIVLHVLIYKIYIRSLRQIILYMAVHVCILLDHMNELALVFFFAIQVSSTNSAVPWTISKIGERERRSPLGAGARCYFKGQNRSASKWLPGSLQGSKGMEKSEVQ